MDRTTRILLTVIGVCTAIALAGYAIQAIALAGEAVTR